MLTAFFTLLFISTCDAQTVPTAPRQDRAQALAKVDYFSTSANYKTGGGSYTSLPNSGTYQNIEMKFAGSYDLDNRWRLFGGVTAAMAQAENNLNSSSSNDLTEINFAAQYWAMKRPVWLIPEVKFTYPLKRISDSTDEIISSEGAMALEGGAWVSHRLGMLRGYGYVGLTYRDESRSMLMPWVLAAEFKPQFWYVLGGLRGFESIKKSGASLDSRLAVTARGSSGTLKYYSPNPALMEGFGESGLYTKDWRAWIGLAQTINGMDYAHGMTISVGGLYAWNAGWNFGGSTSGESSSYEDVQDETERRILRKRQRQQNFQMGNENYDEQLFEDSSPLPEDESVEESESPAPKPKKVRKVKKKKTINTDKMLDDTEKKLEQEM